MECQAPIGADRDSSPLARTWFKLPRESSDHWFDWQVSEELWSRPLPLGLASRNLNFTGQIWVQNKTLRTDWCQTGVGSFSLPEPSCLLDRACEPAEIPSPKGRAKDHHSGFPPADRECSPLPLPERSLWLYTGSLPPPQASTKRATVGRERVCSEKLPRATSELDVLWKRGLLVCLQPQRLP